MTFEELWKQMEETTSEGPGLLLRRVHADARPDIFVGLEMPDGRRLMFLEFAAEAAPDTKDLPKARGFATRITSIGNDRPALELRLTDLGATDLFTSLATDVASVVARADGDAEAVRMWIVRLNQWRRLMQRGAAEGLSSEAQRGLYAELWLLREYLLGPMGDAAIQGWTGPHHASHDFEFGPGAVEVKATAGKQHQVLRIASERQLDATGTPALFLFHLSLDVRHGDGETLVDMVSSVRDVLTERGLTADVEALLFEAGYQDVHAPLYRQRAYTTREENFFEVQEGFPRIVEADLRPGVGDVHYSVAVAECKHFAATPEEVLSVLRKS